MFNVYRNEIETCVVNLVSYREILRYFHLVLGGGWSASPLPKYVFRAGGRGWGGANVLTGPKTNRSL